MRRRNIVSIVVLSIITCGIYYLFAWYEVMSDINYESGESNSAALDIILTFITCGIWGVYAYYKYSQKLARVGAEDSSTITTILALFGLSLISLCILQTNINDALERRTNY